MPSDFLSRVIPSAKPVVMVGAHAARNHARTRSLAEVQRLFDEH